MDVLVCGKYPLKVPENAKGGYLNYIKHIGGKHALAFDHVLESVHLYDPTVYEAFGGAGTFTSIIRGKMHPLTHFITELDVNCLISLYNNFHEDPGVTISQQDARECIGKYPVELLVLDFPDVTIKRATELWSEELERAFSLNPEYVVYTDIANRYLHLQKERYSAIVGKPITNIESYVIAFSDLFYHKWGYSAKQVAYHNEASVSLFVKGWHQPQFKHIASGAGGMVIDSES